MAYMVVLVLDNVELCQAVLDAWQAAGAGGATMLESSGLYRHTQALRDDLGILPSLQTLLSRQEYRHRTLFTVVEDEATADAILDATEKIVGDFRRPHTGIIFVVPVLKARGLRKQISSDASA
ncbi:MAG: hypothetical protein GXO36_04230 [Chloroflexi bacterium]|nr:hypothetical protein [Chloroflexota bacterium]